LCEPVIIAWSRDLAAWRLSDGTLINDSDFFRFILRQINWSEITRINLISEDGKHKMEIHRDDESIAQLEIFFSDRESLIRAYEFLWRNTELSDGNLGKFLFDFDAVDKGN